MLEPTDEARQRLQELKHLDITMEDILMSGMSKDQISWITDEFLSWSEKQRDEMDLSFFGTDPIEKKQVPFTWGTTHMNTVFSPIEPQSYIIFAGSENSGKTAFTVDFAIKNAKEGKVVLYISLEMSSSNIITRIARDHAKITKAQWRERDKIPDWQKDEYMKKKEELRKIEKLIFYGFDRGVNPTCAAIEEIIEIKSPDITIIDNFGLISRESDKQLDHEEGVSRFFMNLAKDTKRPIIMVHHIKKTKDKTDIDAIRGSGKITDDATGVFICSRRMGEDLTPKERSEFLVYEKKDREFGNGGFARLYFYRGTFSDCYVKDSSGEQASMV